MISKANAQELWVGLWHRRHIVFDPKIQPENPDFILLYFVEGHALCIRKPDIEQNEETIVQDSFDRDFALEQYSKWFTDNADIASEKKSRLEFEIENPPPLNKKCPKCDGQATWFDNVNKSTYGVISEGPNIIERCPSCHGNGFVFDVL